MKEKPAIFYVIFIVIFCPIFFCKLVPLLAVHPAASAQYSELSFFVRLGVIIGLILLITAALVLNTPKWVGSTVKTFVVIAILCIIILSVVFFILSHWS